MAFIGISETLARHQQDLEGASLGYFKGLLKIKRAENFGSSLNLRLGQVKFRTCGIEPQRQE